MEKIKVFLGAFINKTNAQNLSCLALARHLDKTKFKVYTLSIYNGDLPVEKIEGVEVYNCSKPFRLSGYFGFFWGIYNADVVYLPRGEMYSFSGKLLKLFKRKSFKTIENKLDDDALRSILALFKTEENMKAAYAISDRLYSITPHIKEYNYKRFGINSEDKILFLPTDTSAYTMENKKVEGLQNVIFIGNDMIRKGIWDYLTLASLFPQITFHIVGSGQGINVANEVEKRNLKNIVYHGLLPFEKIKQLLKNVDLHILPSRSEGFGKVTIETAAAGIPSLLYNDYGAGDWLESGHHGFVVNTVEEMAEKIRILYNDSNEIQKLSKGALQLAEKFNIKRLSKEYENIIEELYWLAKQEESVSK